MATKIRADGGSVELRLPDEVTLKFLQDLVGGLIEMIYCEDGSAFLLNEEGKLHGMPMNEAATSLGILKGVILPGDFYVGDVVFLARDEVRRIS
jgi:hypothetical protein